MIEAEARQPCIGGIETMAQQGIPLSLKQPPMIHCIAMLSRPTAPHINNILLSLTFFAFQNQGPLS
jgi:hypothetical protein